MLLSESFPVVRRILLGAVSGVIAILTAVAPWPVLRAQTAPAAPKPAPAATAAVSGPARPLLWSVGRTTPSYLFGTIHLPDARVVMLGPSVERALGEIDTLVTEIPMDAALQMSVMGKVLLPSDQTLADVVGAPLAARLDRAIEHALPKDAPPGTAPMLSKLLGRMKPWAAMTQLSLLEFLPDMMAGRKPLDALLWERAQKAGKEVGALETIDEQLAVFDQFSVADQKRLLELTLDSLDEARGKPKSPTQELIDAYLTGDLAVLTRVMNDAMEGDRELTKRFTAVALDARNQVMATRIRAKLAEKPGARYFFAVGAAHYAGDTGVVALLRKAGVEVTRVP
jgi:uncharacterized protein YbaP (TraB family)